MAARSSVPARDRRAAAAAFLNDPDFASHRGGREVLRLGAVLGVPFGVVPAALFLELAPHLGFVRPAAWSFGGSFLLFSALARAPHRAVVWAAAGLGSGLLILFALGATIWTLTQSLGSALG